MLFNNLVTNERNTVLAVLHHCLVKWNVNSYTYFRFLHQLNQQKSSATYFCAVYSAMMSRDLFLSRDLFPFHLNNAKYTYFDVYPTVMSFADSGIVSNRLPLITMNFVFFSLIIIPYSVQNLIRVFSLEIHLSRVVASITVSSINDRAWSVPRQPSCAQLFFNICTSTLEPVARALRTCHYTTVNSK